MKVYWESDQSSNTPPIRGYQLEYAILDNVKSIVDTNAPDTASPIDFQVYATDIGMTTAGNTVQILTVRADSTLDGAETYKLALPYGTEKTMQPLYDSESYTTTGPIRVDATAAQMKAALEAVENIQSVKVIRCDEVTTSSGQSGWTGQCPYAGVGGFTYKIRFDAVGDLELNKRTGQLQPLATHDLPLLQVYRNFITAPWSGTGSQVYIRHLETSNVLPTVCYEDLQSFSFQLTYPCHYEVKNLLPDSRYLFRLRVLTEDKLSTKLYSEPGTPSTLVATPKILPPSRPIAPHISTVTDTTLSVVVNANPADLRKFVPTPPITSFEVQSSASTSPNTWTSFEPAAPVTVTFQDDNPGISSAALTGLTPNTSHRFRVRAVNSVGSSVWSNPSKYYTTFSGVPGTPSTPSQSASTSSSMTVSWAPPSNDFGSAIAAYELQHRKYSKLNGAEDKWFNHNTEIDPVMVAEIKEVQTFTTKVDGGSSVSSGSFWLSFDGEVTGPLAYDSSAEDVKSSLESFISSISSVTVRRFSPNNIYSTSPVDGCYTWIIEFSFVGDNLRSQGTHPLLALHKSTLDGVWSGSGGSVQFARIKAAVPSSMKGILSETVNNLNEFAAYDFRARAKNEKGWGPWSSVLSNQRTLASTPSYVYPGERAKNAITTTDNTMSVAATDRTAALSTDADYQGSVGMGGLENQDGGDGMVLILSYGEGQVERARSYFYFTGGAQIYEVPEKAGWEVTKTNIDRFVDVKIWGGGGGGGHGGRGATAGDRITSPSSVYSQGGGGGFVMARLRVVPGEQLTVVVGGGGQQRITEKVGGKGGYNGGGEGGNGIDGGGGGGGGGLSSVLRGTVTLAAAGGGGGGGSTDYCCGHGGGGGGSVAGTGLASGSNTPLDLSKDGGVNGVIRNDFTADDYVAGSSSVAGADDRDSQGMPPLHEHIDRGFAPNASYEVLASGGGGGSLNDAKAGTPGISGSYKVDLTGELNYYGGGDPSMNTVNMMTDSGGSIFALPGHSMLGGRGADGKEGGGGGGGGFYGGGGGGSGLDGAGGGGGCGFIDYTAVWYPDDKRGYGKVGPDKMPAPLVFAVKFDTFSVQWDRGFNSSQHLFAVRAYDVELSKGRDGAGAEAGIKCSQEWFRYAQLRVGRDKVVDQVKVEGLQSETMYCVRVRAVGLKRGLSDANDEVMVVTESEPMNDWDVIATRRLKELHSGRGDASDVLSRPHIHPDVETRGGSSGYNTHRTFNTPNEKIGFVPTPRMGATLLEFGGTFESQGGDARHDLFLFGGMTEGEKCDDAGSTDTLSLGDEDSGVVASQCRKEAGVNNDLWWLDASTGMWANVFENDASISIGGAMPLGREGQSASKMGDGTIVVFGGKTLTAGDTAGTGRNLFLGDMWELSRARVRDEVLTYSGGSNPNRPNLPYTLKEGNEEYFTVNASFAENVLGSGSMNEGELCVEDISVEVSITHSCSKSLTIGLFGPGPYTGDKNFSPENRGSRVGLFGMHPAGVDCSQSVNLLNTVFDDAGKEGGVWESYAEAPWTGSHQGLESLREKFLGMKVNGEWSLEVYDGDIDGTGGTLDEFKIHFKVKPCVEKFAWTEISSRTCRQTYTSGGSGSALVYDGCSGSNTAVRTGSSSSNAGPIPRFRHSAVAMDNILYVIGGEGGSQLNDIWMYDKTADDWLQLNADVQTPSWYGRQLSLTPYGLLAFGGKVRDAEWGYEGRVWHYNVGTGLWNVLGKTEQELGGVQDIEAMKWRAVGLNHNIPYPQVFEDAPQPHRLSSVVGLGFDRTNPTLDEGNRRVLFGKVAEPMVVLFGGDVGLSRAKYNNDLRVLRLRNLAEERNDGRYEEEWEEMCGFRLENGGTADNFWTATCGAGGGIGSVNKCEVRDIIIRAWCLKEYQTIGGNLL